MRSSSWLRRGGLGSVLALIGCALGLPARAQQGAAPPAAPITSDVPGESAPPEPARAPAPKVIIPPPEPRPWVAPPGAEAPPAGDGEAKQKKKKGDTGARSDDDADSTSSNAVSVGARLIMGFERRSERPAGGQTDPADQEYGFTLRQIRLSVKGELAERFRANVSFDLSDALEPEAGAAYDQPPYLRTATIEYRYSREFRLQVGRFKRPFSHLELESASDLPILRRGLFNGLALEDNQWGDRAIGVMASGRLKEPRLRWYLSLTNPDWSPTLRAEGVDVIGRVEWTLIKGLVLAANAAYKRIELGNDQLNDVAYGGDVTWKLGDANFLLESNSVALPFEVGRPRALGALFMFDYELALNHDWSLQPVFFAEYADADTDVLENESLRLAFGLNALGYAGFRVMPQVELVRSIGDTSAQNPWLESERLSLIFSLVL
jgi:Phosphate-selective porin O and P